MPECNYYGGRYVQSNAVYLNVKIRWHIAKQSPVSHGLCLEHPPYQSCWKFYLCQLLWIRWYTCLKLVDIRVWLLSTPDCAASAAEHHKLAFHGSAFRAFFSRGNSSRKVVAFKYLRHSRCRSAEVPRQRHRDLKTAPKLCNDCSCNKCKCTCDVCTCIWRLHL